MRYLLVRHPIFCCIVLFGAIMLAIRYGIAPWIVHTYGFPGVVVTLAVIFAIGCWMERRSSY